MKTLLLLLLNFSLFPKAFGQEKENCDQLLSTEIITDTGHSNFATIRSLDIDKFKKFLEGNEE